MSTEIDDANEFGQLTEKSPASVPDKDNDGITEDELRVALARTPVAAKDAAKSPKPGEPTQWALHGAGFKATTRTVSVLVPGCYDIRQDQYGVFAVPSLPPSGLLLELPEMRSEYVFIPSGALLGQRKGLQGRE